MRICKKLSLKTKAPIFFVHFPRLMPPDSCPSLHSLQPPVSVEHTSCVPVGFVVGFGSNLSGFCRQDLISEVEGLSLQVLSLYFYVIFLKV